MSCDCEREYGIMSLKEFQSCTSALPKLEDNPVVPKQKSTKRKDCQVERENGKGREGGGGDGGHAEVDRACGQVGS